MARVAVVYAAVAFAVLEASDIVIPALGWPEWTIRWVIALALIGFPVTLILAWIFASWSWPLAVMAVVFIPLGIWTFGKAEAYAKRTGKLKRVG